MSFIINEEKTISFNNTPESEKELWNTNGMLSPRILIATPMYGGMCVGQYAAALMLTPTILGNHGMGTYYSYMTNESLITRARNRCVHEFLQTDATHLMFIDADIGFNPHDIAKLVKRNVDIVCGLYPKKEINWVRVAKAVENGVPPEQLMNYGGATVINMVKNENTFVPPDQLLEIHNGGTGFMLIRRSVFLELMDKVPEYTNDMYHSIEKPDAPMFIKEFFATSIEPESNRLLSEDYHFCRLARMNGIKVWADPSIDLTHSGTYVFTGATEKVQMDDGK